MNDVELADYVNENLEGETLLLADGFAEAFLGIGWQCSRPFACYDRKKCIEILVARDKMTPEDADEFFEFNVVDSYVGEQTPIFVTGV